MKPLIAGNWKMNGSNAEAQTLIEGIAAEMQNAGSVETSCDLLVCPPALHIPLVKKIINSESLNVVVGGQDCSPHDKGAYTGDISASMLADAGCGYVILGHSERREYHAELDELISRKAAQAHAHGLITIICVGETESERDAGHEVDVVGAQLEAALPECSTSENTVIAYEPVWAIGTGKSATAEDVRAMHSFIREEMGKRLAQGERIRILYGGSVKPANAAELLSVPHVNGALIGGASLKADDFIAIAKAASQTQAKAA